MKEGTGRKWKIYVKLGNFIWKKMKLNKRENVLVFIMS